MNTRAVVAACSVSILGAAVVSLAALGQWPFDSGFSAGQRFPAADYVDDARSRLGAADTIGVQGEPTQRNYIGDCGSSRGSDGDPACGDIIVEVPENYQYRQSPVLPPAGQDDDWDECDTVSTIYACVGDVHDLAEMDLADFLNVDRSSIHLVNTELTEWPDSCLGVRRSDVACAEVMTSGFRLVFDVEGRRYTYHTDLGTRVVGVE